MTRKLLRNAAVAAIALTALIGGQTADARGGGFGGGGVHDRDFFPGRGFRGDGFGPVAS